ncbi:MAG: cytochrome P450, partial [Arsenicicoccus sp.]
MGRGPTLPPGPRTPALVQTVQAFTGRQAAFERHRRRYGDPFTVSMLPGPQRLVMFSDPAAIKEIFAGDPVQFSGALGNEMLRAAMGDRSVMLNDGEAHRAIRRYLMPAFSPAAVRTYRPIVERAAAAEVASWRPGQTVSALERMSSLTLDVMTEMVLG